MSRPSRRARPKQTPEDDARAAMNLALDRRELFEAGQLALGLSRLPGRMEFDEPEAYRILQHLIGQYALGQFAPDEVVACHDELGLRPLREIEEQLDRLLSMVEWRDAVMLTRAACKRYLKQSTLQGALRQLREWFSSPTSEASQSAAAAGYERAWISSYFEALDHVRRAGWADDKARDGLGDALSDGAVATRWADRDELIDPGFWIRPVIFVDGIGPLLRDGCIDPYRVIEFCRADLERLWPITMHGLRNATGPNDRADVGTGTNDPPSTLDAVLRKARKRRSDETRPLIKEAIRVLQTSRDWTSIGDGERCRRVEEHLKKPTGWCKPRSFGRAKKEITVEEPAGTGTSLAS